MASLQLLYQVVREALMRSLVLSESCLKQFIQVD